jgi:hypothetical protein
MALGALGPRAHAHGGATQAVWTKERLARGRSTAERTGLCSVESFVRDQRGTCCTIAACSWDSVIRRTYPAAGTGYNAWWARCMSDGRDAFARCSDESRAVARLQRVKMRDNQKRILASAWKTPGPTAARLRRARLSPLRAQSRTDGVSSRVQSDCVACDVAITLKGRLRSWKRQSAGRSRRARAIAALGRGAHAAVSRIRTVRVARRVRFEPVTAQEHGVVGYRGLRRVRGCLGSPRSGTVQRRKLVRCQDDGTAIFALNEAQTRRSFWHPQMVARQSTYRRTEIGRYRDPAALGLHGMSATADCGSRAVEVFACTCCRCAHRGAVGVAWCGAVR